METYGNNTYKIAIYKIAKFNHLNYTPLYLIKFLYLTLAIIILSQIYQIYLLLSLILYLPAHRASIFIIVIYKIAKFNHLNYTPLLLIKS